MQTPFTSRRHWIARLACIFALMLGLPLSAARAAHSHEHIYVTMVDYLGYDRSSEHYMIKVRRNTDDGPVFYVLHFLANVSRLRGHEGERFQVSLTSDGSSWARLTTRHGTYRIHQRERLD